MKNSEQERKVYEHLYGPSAYLLVYGDRLLRLGVGLKLGIKITTWRQG